MRRMSLALLLGVGLVAGAWAPAAFAATDYTNTITTTGTGRVDVQPDVARIGIGVSAAGQTAAAAASTAGEKTRSVLSALRQAGVRDDDITVADVSVFRKTDRRGNLLRYVARVGIRVETTDLGAIPLLIDAALRGGASSIRNVTFDVQDRTEAVQEALQEAMTIARQKAEALAASENRQVGEVLVISEGHAAGPRPAAIAADAVAGSAGGGSGSTTIPITPPTLHASGSVTVTYRLI